MSERPGLDLASIKPVDDIDASRRLSAETHRWLREAVVGEPRPGAGGPAGADERRQRSRRRQSRHRVRRGSHLRGTSRRVLLTTLLVATVAALVVLLPGLLSDDGSVTQPPAAQAQILHRISVALGRQPETILVQRMRWQVFLQSSAGAAPHSALGPVSSLTIDAASRNGSVQRSFSTSSDDRSGFEQLSTANSLQIYDPRDDTIYATTLAACEAAVQRGLDRSIPKGSHSVTATFSLTSRDSTGPGQLSVFEQRLREHLYRLGGRTTVDGRAALKLVPLRATISIPSSGSGTAREYLGTVYVSPTTYYPIKEVTRVPAAGSPFGTPAGSVSTSVNEWSEYRVLPATRTNAALLSLTARHPHAHVVHGAEAYLRASNAQAHG